jgi:hypothetical protein
MELTLFHGGRQAEADIDWRVERKKVNIRSQNTFYIVFFGRWGRWPLIYFFICSKLSLPSRNPQGSKEDTFDPTFIRQIRARGPKTSLRLNRRGKQCDPKQKLNLPQFKKVKPMIH